MLLLQNGLGRGNHYRMACLCWRILRGSLVGLLCPEWQLRYIWIDVVSWVLNGLNIEPRHSRQPRSTKPFCSLQVMGSAGSFDHIDMSLSERKYWACLWLLVDAFGSFGPVCAKLPQALVLCQGVPAPVPGSYTGADRAEAERFLARISGRGPHPQPLAIRRIVWMQCFDVFCRGVKILEDRWRTVKIDIRRYTIGIPIYIYIYTIFGPLLCPPNAFLL